MRKASFYEDSLFNAELLDDIEKLEIEYGKGIQSESTFPKSLHLVQNSNKESVVQIETFEVPQPALDENQAKANADTYMTSQFHQTEINCQNPHLFSTHITKKLANKKNLINLSTSFIQLNGSKQCIKGTSPSFRRTDSLATVIDGNYKGKKLNRKSRESNKEESFIPQFPLKNKSDPSEDANKPQNCEKLNKSVTLSSIERIDKPSTRVDSSFLGETRIISCQSENLASANEATSFVSSNEKLHLSSWGLPQDILENYERSGISCMFSWQVECLSLPGVLEGKNLVYSAPTSAGKTLVAEIILLKNVLEKKKKGIFILPFVSIAREKTFHLQKLFQVAGLKVEGFMGSQSPPGGFQKTDIAICTIEKANNIINRLIEENKVEDLGIVVVDELHMVGDNQRGYLLELLLTKLQYVMTLSKNNFKIQVIGMSATLPNLHVLAGWLNASLYSTTFRPIPLLQMIKIGSVLYQENFDVIRDLNSSAYTVKDDPDHLVKLCLETVLEGYSLLIFCPTKAWCEKIALSIAFSFFSIGNENSEYSKDMVEGIRKRLDGKNLSQVIEALKNCPAGLDSVLARSLAFGTAFHHAGLTFDERDIIEASFRAGYLPVLIATSTLSSGVNLPARRVIIRSPNSGGRMIDPLVYKQMVGRAGRKGKDTQGESILMCASNERYKAEQLVNSSLPPISSCLHRNFSLTSCMKRAILEVVVSGAANTPEQLEAYWNCTLLAASLGEAEDAANSQTVSAKPVLEECMGYFIENELVRYQDNGTKVIGTQLGKAILASGLSPDEGLHVFSELQRARQCFVLENELHLVYQVTPVYVSDAWPKLEWLRFLELWESLSPGMKKVGELVGIEESFIVSAMKGIVNTKVLKMKKLLAIHQRFYAALALHDLVHEVELRAVVAKYGATKGLLQALQQSAATFAGMVTVFCNRLGWYNLELLIAQYQNRLQFGIQRDLCDLVKISLLNGYRARLLFNVGLETLNDIAHSSPQEIGNIFLHSGPFQSCKNENGNGFILGPSGSPLSIPEASKCIVNEARILLQKELSLDHIDWDQKARTACSPSSSNQDNTSKQSNSRLPLSSRIIKDISSSACRKSINVDNDALSNRESVVNRSSLTSKRPSPSISEVKKGKKSLKEDVGKVFPGVCEERSVEDASSTELKAFAQVVGDLSKTTRAASPFMEKSSAVSSTSKSCLQTKGTETHLLSRENANVFREISIRKGNCLPGDSLFKSSNLVMAKDVKGKFLFGKSKSRNTSPPVLIPSSPEICSPSKKHKLSQKVSRNTKPRRSVRVKNRNNCQDVSKSLQSSTNEAASSGTNLSFSNVMNSSNHLSESLQAAFLETMHENDSGWQVGRKKKNRSSIESQDFFLMSSDDEIEKENICRAGMTTPLIKNRMEGISPREHFSQKKSKKEEPVTPFYDVCSEEIDFGFDSSPSEKVSENWKRKNKKTRKLGNSFAHPEIENFSRKLLTTEAPEDESQSSIDDDSLKFFDASEKFISEDNEHSLVITEVGALSMGRESIEKDLEEFECSLLVNSSQDRALNDFISDSVLDKAFDKFLHEEKDSADENNEILPSDSIESNELIMSSFNESSALTDSFHLHLQSSPEIFETNISSGISICEDEEQRNDDIMRSNESKDGALVFTSNVKREYLSILEKTSDELDQTMKCFHDLQSSPKASFVESSQSLCIIDVTGDERLFQIFIEEWKTKTEFSLSLTCDKVPSQPLKEGIGWRFCGRSRRTPAQSQPVAGLVVEHTKLVLTGIAICWGHKNSYFVSLKTFKEGDENEEAAASHFLSTPSSSARVPLPQRINAVKEVLSEVSGRIIGMWKVKESIKLLHRSGFVVPMSQFLDPRVATWLLDPTSKEMTISKMVSTHSEDYFHILEGVSCTAGSDGLGIPGTGVVDGDSLRERSAIESVLVFHLNQALGHRLEEAGLKDVWISVEMRSIYHLALMELNGLGFSRATCQDQKNKMQEKLDLLEAEALQLAGHPFSISCPSEVAKVIYSELGLGHNTKRCAKVTSARGSRTVVKKGRSTGPTNKEALEKLADLHPLPSIILQWRKIHSALTKFVLPMSQEVVSCVQPKEDRVFPVCNTFTATGRITFHEPNVQNMPKKFPIELPRRPLHDSKRKETRAKTNPVMIQLAPLLEPKEQSSEFSICLRDVIVAGGNRVILAADYCQLELRILAHLSGEYKLLHALNTGRDVFIDIASEIHSLPAEEISSDMRQSAKQICYGLIYGMGEKSLSDQLSVSVEEAKEFLTTFHRRFPAVRDFVLKSIEEAKEKGYTRTLAGRKRFLPGLKSSSIADIGQCERQAVNTRIQGSAADLVKKAMIGIEEKLRENFPNSPATLTQSPKQGQCLSGAFFVLQLHDELIYEVMSIDVIQVAQIVKQEMENAIQLSVCLPVKIKVGLSWGSLQTLNL